MVAPSNSPVDTDTSTGGGTATGAVDPADRPARRRARPAAAPAAGRPGHRPPVAGGAGGAGASTRPPASPSRRRRRSAAAGGARPRPPATPATASATGSSTSSSTTRPACPKFAGDNGGATYQGVTADTIKVIFFESRAQRGGQRRPRAPGPAATEEELEDDLRRAARSSSTSTTSSTAARSSSIRDPGDCPTTPPDYDSCLRPPARSCRKQPFMVIWATPLYADGLRRVGQGRDHLSIGGWHFDDTFFTPAPAVSLRRLHGRHPVGRP